uniref:CSON015230 protein n=1 Tax=Culicoides sonorensis TaxID=179676 RepID=A0A336MQ98_CULSO
MKNFNSICFKNNKKLSSFFIITILLSTLISTIKCSSFCDFCQCYDDRASSLFIENDDIDEMFHVVNCNGEQLINKNALTTSYKMQTLEWPLTEKRIIGYFNHLNLTVLPKLEHAPSNKVIVLNFDDNLIETIGTKPFQYFENLVEISLRNNFISDLPKDLLYGLRKLDHLNLSNNSITFVREDFIPDSLQLKSIDLSHNSIKSLSSDIIQGLQTVEQINLNHNEIYVIKSGGSQGKTKWRNLNLSGNKLKVLTDVSLIDFPELTKLDLSHNGLVNIERDTFVNLSLLEKLDLSANELHGVVMKLPESLDKLKLGNNSLRLWPLEHTPKNLRYLDVHGNELTEIFNGQDVVPHLKVLNISRNVIDIFPLINFTHLSILDLSYNAFTEVPKHLPKYAPFLEELIMDNNPLSSLKLGERMRLSKLSFKNMPFIESIDAFTFSNVGK